MPQRLEGPAGATLPAPSMLDLVRLSPRLLFPPGGVDLYRQIALLTDLAQGEEVIDVACGKGVPLEYFVREHGAIGSGVDIDPRLIEVAEARSKKDGIAARLQFQTGRSDALPYRDGIFDVAVGELGMAAHCDPADAVRELVRVTRPGGAVVLVQLVWTAPVDDIRRRVLSEHLGAKPLMLVEWKRLLRDAGLVELHTEDWSDEHTAFRPAVAKPFPDFSEIFSLPEKLAILRRAWARWGWRGVRLVLAREREVHRLLTRERILALDLIKGRRPSSPPRPSGGIGTEAEDADPGAGVRSTAHRAGAAPGGVAGGAEEDGEETAGLPLFGEDRRSP